ncbi:uncharacterized protein GGS22DRAFT_199669 [Annulohypoxylon maeteangense]|uniref:uncharacterized protein n=1 Tax=Annulohypoxylon maeteangense TaxID=1927788 RepID=UPI0020072F38|nr:uncharacterized protein GGS22DRAFT_199669 [Annulohypoxylon maeteangense]KAI0886383.1 hypothetical protein GGS22DRAFT_199669 [Annulohypoxylon maeteangense]
MDDPAFLSLPFQEQVKIYDSQPALEAPEGITPNFEHPGAENGKSITIVVLCLTATTILFSLRVYSRLFCLKKVCYVVLCAIIFVMIRSQGFYVHQWNIHMGEMVEMLLLAQVQMTFYNLTMWFSKAAILLEWSRIFPPYPIRNTFFWTCHALIWGNAALYIAATIFTHLSCIPYKKMFYPWVAGYCHERKSLDLFVPAFNLAVDLTILAFPQRTIWKLNLPRKRKVAVSIIFSSGLMACACAAARVHVSVRSIQMTDFLWIGSQSILWGLGEMTFAFAVFCVPAIPKAFKGSRIAELPRYFWTKLRSTASLSKRPSNESGQTSWPQPEKIPSSSETYGHMHMGYSGRHQKSIGRIHSEEVGSANALGDLSKSPDTGVLLTTDFVTSVDTNSLRSDEQPFKRQHPWV